MISTFSNKMINNEPVQILNSNFSKFCVNFNTICILLTFLTSYCYCELPEYVSCKSVLE